MNNDKVWYWSTENIFNDSRLFPMNYPNAVDYKEYYELEKLGENETEQQHKRWKELLKKSIELGNMFRRDFFPIPKENMPDMMYAPNPTQKGLVLPDIFSNGALMSHKPFVDILKQFRLGQTQISEPMRFFDLTTNDYVNDTEYYFINIAERHQYFLPEKRINPIYPKPSVQVHGVDVYYSPSTQKEFTIENLPISIKAVDCEVDIWHDPQIRGSLFLSNNLAQALLKSAIDKNLLTLWECPLFDIFQAA